jgi:hypothetical protein
MTFFSSNICSTCNPCFRRSLSRVPLEFYFPGIIQGLQPWNPPFLPPVQIPLRPWFPQMQLPRDNLPPALSLENPLLQPQEPSPETSVPPLIIPQPHDEEDYSGVPPVVRSQMVEVRAKIGATRLHQRGARGQGTRVGVLDSGVVDHVFFRNGVEHQIRYPNPNAHGTHVAGIIHNLAPEAKLVNFQSFSDDYTDPGMIGRCFDRIVETNIDVVNISSGADRILGMPDQLFPYQGRNVSIDAIWEDFRRRGILIVISAGNNGSADEKLYRQLASTYCLDSDDADYFLGVPMTEAHRNKWPITNTSCDCNYKFSPFNSINKGVMCMSFGGDILSTVENIKYVPMSGTSMSTPQVTGILSLLVSWMKQQYPTMEKPLRAELVRKYLLHQGTSRNLKKMMRQLSVPKSFQQHDDRIMQLLSMGNRQGASFEISRMAQCCGYKIVESNPQFREIGNNLQKEEIETKIASYLAMKQGLSRKYTSLSLGYGIVDLNKFESIPPSLSEIPDKDPFEL